MNTEISYLESNNVAQFCSNSMYNEYLEEVQHILLLFKKTQEIHRKLLQILKFHIQENLSNVEVTLFKEGIRFVFSYFVFNINI